MRKILWFLSLLLLTSPAFANWNGKNAAGTTITFFNVNDCTSVVCVPITQMTDGTGAAFGVTGNPFFVSPASGATFPVSAAALPLPAGAATSAAQTTAQTSLSTIATNSGTQATSAAQTTAQTSLSTIATNSATQATAANQSTIITALGTLNTTAGGPVTLGSAAGGWTRTLFAGLSTTVQTVKGTAGQLGKLYCDNPNTTAIYVETFDVSGTVTLGTTAPTQAYYIPATNAAGFSLPLVGDQYANAIKIAAVTTENGGTAPTTPGNCNVSWN
jgi:hypothetical protein